MCESIYASMPCSCERGERMLCTCEERDRETEIERMSCMCECPQKAEGGVGCWSWSHWQLNAFPSFRLYLCSDQNSFLSFNLWLVLHSIVNAQSIVSHPSWVLRIKIWKKSKCWQMPSLMSTPILASTLSSETRSSTALMAHKLASSAGQRARETHLFPETLK